MPFNGSGTYNAPASSWNPAVEDTEISVDDWADLLADFAAGLSKAICTDGQSTTTARIPFAEGISISDGLVGTPGINFTSDPDNGIYRIGTNNWGLSAGGTKVADLSASGIVLSVAGNQNFTNDAILSFMSGTKLHTGHSGAASQVETSGNTTIFTWGPTAEEFYIPGHTTTASAANCFIDSSTGKIIRSTSSLRAKTDIEAIEAPDKALELRGIWFRSTLPDDDPTQSFYGFGAEEVAAVDPRFALWGQEVTGYEDNVGEETGSRKPILSDVRPVGINLAAICAHLVEVAKAQDERIKALESR